MAGFTITGFNHIAYPISTRQHSLPLYRDILGLAVIPSMVDGPAVIWTQMDSGTMVHPIEAPEPGKLGTFHLAFGVESVPEAMASLEASGIKINSHGERHDGQEFAFVFDPDGNRLEFASVNDRKVHGRVCDEWGITSWAKDGVEGHSGRHQTSDAPIRVLSTEHAGVPITDRKRSVTFYRDVVGLKIIPEMVESDSITWLALPDGSMLHLVETEQGDAHTYHGGFVVEDLDVAIDAVKQLDAENTRVGDRLDGRRALHFDDADGNHVELVSNDPLKSGHRVADEWGYTTDV
ncbi:MAG: VOC family protein [Chloroflexi bacterium]|jgi:catechol 2,3-dioxygenase-like lactoylglutathione lyase family enzyme|nr:VOC family protein [Chloroflexota bacterium]MBT4072963.1 VOC family protein [Chloroflexota bacterium]MBT4515213.1 VOC family protein [Chloroflexota bacterium]MBT5319753.1 VOC family protein [Chloroflexota bacterium]MBT6682408.1 VOC family protein [Chloroflexota bacterium]